MVYLRSRTRTGDDRVFQAYSHPPIISDDRILRYPMRVLGCRVFDPNNLVLFSPYMGFVGYTLGFSGEGRTVHETAEDTCRKLSSYIESRVADEWPPYHLGCIERHLRCMSMWGKFEDELDMETIDAPGEMEWTDRFDYKIVAELDKDTGHVKQIGWSHESDTTWYVWKEPGFSSLSQLNEPQTSSCPETTQNLASVRSNSQKPLLEELEDIMAMCDSFFQPLRSGLSRLALDREFACLQQIRHAVASKDIMSSLGKEGTGLQAQSRGNHSSKELVIREEQSNIDLASEARKVKSLDKKKFSSEVDNEESSFCSKGLFHEMAAGKSKAVLDACASSAERAAEVGKGAQLDEGCSPSISISVKVRSNDVGFGSEDKNSTKTVEIGKNKVFEACKS